MVWCGLDNQKNMIHSKNKADYNTLAFVPNTQENRKRILGHGDKVVCRGNYSGTYELVYDAQVDCYRSRLGVSRLYGHHNFSEVALLRKASARTLPDWGKQWARVANSMRTHGINQAVSDLIEKMLIIGLPEMQRLAVIRSSYDASELYPAGMEYEEKQKLENKYTEEWEAKHASVLKGTRAWEILSLHTQNHTAIRPPKIVKINLPAYRIEEEIDAVREGKQEHGSVRRDGQKRDLSFSVWKDKEGRGLKASYASEYAGCGNGAYYIPFSLSYAFYAEHD